MSLKFWGLPQKYNLYPLKNREEFQTWRGFYDKKCFHFFLFFGGRRHKNFFSFEGNQLLENAI